MNILKFYVIGERLEKFDTIEEAMEAFNKVSESNNTNYKALGVDYYNPKSILGDGSIDLYISKNGENKISSDYKAMKLTALEPIVEKIRKMI